MTGAPGCAPRLRGPLLRLAVALHLFAGSAAASAAPIDLDSLAAYSLRTWSKEDGLAAHAASAVAQTRDGYLWIATDEGLVRFDGTRFTLLNKESAPGLRDSRILSLVADRGGTLWIGTERGLSSLREGVVREHRFTDDAVMSLSVTRQGVLWAGTSQGLFHAAGPNRFERAPGMLSRAQIRAITEDSEGAVWVGTSDAGLFRCRADACERVAEASIASVRALARGLPQGIWVGTPAGGLFRIRGQSIEHWTRRDGLPDDSIHALLITADGSLWIGTNGGGLARRRDGKFELPRSGTGPELLRSLIEDRDGNVWAASVDGGLTRFARAQFTVLRGADGLAGDIVLAVYEAPDGDLWAGSAGKGVSRLHDGKWIRYDTKNGLRHDVVLTIHGDRAGNIWIGTAGGGLTRFREGRFTAFTVADGLSSDVVAAVLPARDGTLWIGTTDGVLHRMVDGRITRVPHWPVRRGILTLLEGGDGTLWVGTDGDGLVRMSRGETAVIGRGDGLGSDVIFALVEDSTGSVWIGTGGGGLVRWKGGRLASVRKANGLREDLVQQLLADDAGFLWLGGNHGISRIELAAAHAVAEGRAGSLPVQVFGTADGLLAEETNGGIFPSAWKGADGRLYFATMAGLAVTAQRVESRPVALQPLIEEVRTGRNRPLQTVGALVRVPPRADRVELVYSAPAFAGRQTTYRYLLEGFDSGWVEAQKERIAQYTRIPPGRYTFRVAARSGDGAWSSPASVPVHVLPAFYETTAFRGAMAILSLAVLLLLHRLRTRSLRQRHQALERLMEERSRAVESLHRSEEHFRMLIENASDMVMITSLDGTITYASPSASRLLDRPAEETVGRSLRSLVRAEDAPLLDETIFAGLTPGEIATALVRAPVGGKPDRHLELLAQRLQFDSSTDHLLINCRDTTHRKVLEQRLEQATRIASLGRLAATIAHEFNNILMGVSTIAEVLRRMDSSDSRTHELARKISDAVARGKRITDDVLRYARSAEPVVASIDVALWAPRLASELRQLLQQQVDVRVTVARPGLAIEGDHQQLVQVFTNLALNARDAMPQGGALRILFKAATDEELRERGLAAGDYVHAIVEDEGEGIPADVLPHIFEPLFTTKLVHGTGLGLAVVHQIITRHGGHIAADSEPGRGSAFHIFLRASSVAGGGVAGVEPAPIAQRVDGMRILLVEDDALVAAGLRMNLEEFGAEVFVAMTGGDGVAALSRGEYDAVILDVGLPDISGTLVYEQIAGLLPSLPVIFSTGHAEVAILDAYMDRKNVGFLRKPYDVEDVVKELRALIALNSKDGASAKPGPL